MNGGDCFGKCAFIYPGISSSESVTVGPIVLITCDERKSEKYPNSYSAVDTIGHEYAHFVQMFFGLNTSLGGNHYLHENIIDTQIDDKGWLPYFAKDKGLKCAWGEGWATYFSIVAQKTFSEDLKRMPTVGDDKYTSHSGVEYDLDRYFENYPFDGEGDGDEVVVSRILFKLHSQNVDIFDKFSIDNQKMWDVAVKYRTTLLSDFINGLYEEGYDRFDLGVLLNQFNVVIHGLSIENSYLDTNPTFSWSTYMGSLHVYYDSFDLFFYDEDKKQILRIEDIRTTGQVATFTIDNNSWDTILASKGTKYYVSLSSRNTLNYISGPYYSNLFEFNKPTEAKNEIMVQPSEWLFEPQYFYQSNNYGHTNTTLNLNGLNILTNRLRCGYIENSYIVLSPMRKNAGLAYLELYFDRPVYRFSFEYSLWSNDERINARNSSISIEYLDVADEWTTSFNLFEIRPNIPNKDDGFAEFMMCFQNGTYGIRIVMISPAVGDRNKGRLCLDNLYFLTNNN